MSVTPGGKLVAETARTRTEPGAADALDGPETLSRAFKGALAAVRRLRGRETHRPGELSYAQYSLLFALGYGSGLSVRDLALTAELSPASVTQMLDHLAADGLVARVRSETDKRVVVTSLTERGRAVVQARRARYEPRWLAALSEFSDEELLIAARVLDRLRESFDDFPASEEDR
jgi:DNA-binding MarR family transcriptional regulator